MSSLTLLVAGPPSVGKRTFLATLSTLYSHPVLSTSSSHVSLYIHDLDPSHSLTLTFTLTPPEGTQQPDCVLLLYDLAEYSTYTAIKSPPFSQLRGRLLTYLVGNKLDIAANERAVEYEDAQGYAQGVMPMIEVSAKAGKNIEMLIKMIRNKLTKHHLHSPNNEQSLKGVEDRIINIEDRLKSQLSSQVNTVKSQDRNTDTAHFHTDHLQFSE
jgi:tRNA U34 5-carboxymethylaminomethyl modifying GTPase MnmE/TrmE